MKTMLFTILIVVSMIYASNAGAEDLFKLDIIHFNDFHARFEETSIQHAICRTNDTKCMGGFPRLYHQVQELLREKPDSLFLYAGDSFRGTSWETLYRWTILQQMMNLLPLDAHTLGNHDFDYGPEGLVPYILGLKAPVVLANIDIGKEPSFKGLFTPHIVLERKGRKIGIIGIITADTKNLTTPGDVEFTDPGEAAIREARVLTNMGVDIIILLSHCGLKVDKELAAKYAQYIDIIVGGHSHSVLWNNKVAPSGENVAGNYPEIVETGDGEKYKTVIVQAGSQTKYLGNLTVYFDSNGRYANWNGGPIFLGRSIPEDKRIRAILSPYKELVEKFEKVVVGESLLNFDIEDCKLGECGLGDALVDAQNEYAKRRYRSELPYISFRQRERINYSVAKGAITEGLLMELLFIDDKIETFELQGRHILEALEISVVGGTPFEPFKGNWSLQVSGLHVAYDMTKSDGERITSVVVDKTRKNLDPVLYYQVTLPAYLGTGGNGYLVFKHHKRNVKNIGREVDMFKKYIKKHGPLKITTDGRIRIITERVKQ